jgi:hypothetical protein
LVDQSRLIAIIATAIRDVRVDYPAIEPGIAHESVPFAKAVLDALDKAGLNIVPKEPPKAQKANDAQSDVIGARSWSAR